MPKPFHQLSVSQFQELVRSFDWQRTITEVHMHHTWQPNHSQYQGLASIEGMWDYHVNTNHWSDIAQHISIAPDGTIWTGRGWNSPPASSTGHNGTAEAGPFMFETIGNFDSGHDPFAGDQKEAVIAVIVALLDQFDLPVSALRFHRQLGSPKSCPGNSIDYDAFCAEIESHRRGGGRGRSAGRTSGTGSATEKRKLGEIKSLLSARQDNWSKDLGASCCAEHMGPAASRSASGRSWSASEREVFMRHAINLRDGHFISSGNFATTPNDVRRLFNTHLASALAEAQAQGRPLRVLFWAHGGLCSEDDTLQHVLDYHRGWLSAGVYPIYFIWETDHETALRDIFLGTPAARGWVTDITDASLEFTLQTVGRPLWRQIKDYAAHAVQAPDGGGLFTAQQLAAFVKAAGASVELYAMGHSAGSIFHSWFLPAALAAGAGGFKELFLLAPAITVDGFKSRLLKHVGAGKGIDHCSMFTMTEKAEREDNVITIYRKSLLYFVSRACEEADETPILGLQEDVYRDADLRVLFGIDGAPGAAAGDIQWSPNGRTTNSTTHGGFDNDPPTLHSMVKRITGIDATPFADMAPRKLTPVAATGRKVALCIGIDKYARKPLSGCVNDARQWKSALEGLGFETRLITDELATYDGIVGSLRDLIQGSRPGDQLVFQYAGHGTHVDDVNGDEALENASDNQDEALVPVDFTSGRFLIDDDIGELMDSLPAGVSLTCFMDCCHSGSNTRAFGFGVASTAAAGEVSRYLPVPAEIMMKHVSYRRSLPIKAARRAYEGKPEVLFAACSPRQEAKESGGHGYFTITAVPMLAQGAGRLTHAQFIAAVQKAFPDHVDDQNPQLDCSEERLGSILLGAPSAREIPVSTQEPAPEPTRPGTLDLETLNETMNIYIKLLDRLA